MAHRIQAEESNWLKELRYLNQEGFNAFLIYNNLKDVYPVQGLNGVEYKSLSHFLTRKSYLTGNDKDKYGGIIRYGIGSGITIEAASDRSEEEEELLKEMFMPGYRAEDEQAQASAGGASEGEILSRLRRSFDRDLEEERRRVQGSARESLLAIYNFLSRKMNMCLIIDQVEKIAPCSDISLSLEDRMNIQILIKIITDFNIRGNMKNTIFMLTEDISKVSKDITSAGPSIATVNIGWPDERQRQNYISHICNELKKQFETKEIRFAEGVSEHQLALPTSGFSCLELRKLFRASYARGCPIDLDMVRERKKRIIARESQGLLEDYEARHGLDMVGGLGTVKDVFREYARHFTDAQKRALIPTAILEVGERGIGKTWIVRALAKEVGINCLKVKNLRSMWVGESERQIERVFELVKSYCPLIVIFDEIDGMFERRGSSFETHSVERHLLTAMLEFMSEVESEHRGEILIVGISNRPDLLDDALIDRFRNLIIPFFVPSRDELPEIVDAIARENGVALEDGFEMERVTNWLEGYTPRHIYFIYRDAIRSALLDGRDRVSTDDFEKAYKDYLPHRNQTASKLQTLLAIKYCTHRRFLPEHEVYGYDPRSLAENEDELDELIAELKASERFSRKGDFGMVILPENVRRKKGGRGKTTLNIANIVCSSCSDGPGRRTVIWVRGCEKRCLGCFNEAYQTPSPECLVDIGALCSLIKEMREARGISGITLTGGEPFLQADALAPLAEYAHELGLSVITFTGYLWEEIATANNSGWADLLSNTDLLIDGPFELDLATDRGLRGSSNQRYFYLTETLVPYAEQIEDGEQTRSFYLDSSGRLRFCGFPGRG